MIADEVGDIIIDPPVVNDVIKVDPEREPKPVQPQPVAINESELEEELDKLEALMN